MQFRLNLNHTECSIKSINQILMKTSSDPRRRFLTDEAISIAIFAIRISYNLWLLRLRGGIMHSELYCAFAVFAAYRTAYKH